MLTKRKTKTETAKKQLETWRDFHRAVLQLLDKPEYAGKLPPQVLGMFVLGFLIGRADAGSALAGDSAAALKIITGCARGYRKYSPKVPPISERRLRALMEEIYQMLPVSKEKHDE